MPGRGNTNYNAQMVASTVSPIILVRILDIPHLGEGADVSLYLTDIVNCVQATLSTALTGDNNDLVFTSRRGGSWGNDTTVEYLDPSGNDEELAVSVSGQAITVSLATGEAGAITSTASDIKTAIEAHQQANELVTVANKSGNDGSGVVTAMYSGSPGNGSPLTGGADVAYYDEDGNAQVYTGCYLTYDKVELSKDNTVDSCKLKIDNVDRVFSAYAVNYRLHGVEVHVLRAFREVLEDGDAQTLFKGKIKNILLSETFIEATVATDFDLSTKTPRRLYWPRCSWGFKSTECGYSGAESSCPHTVAACRDTMDNIVNYGGFPYIPSAKDPRYSLDE